MEKFSLVERNMQSLQRDVEERAFRAPAKPWSEKQMTESARLSRIAKADKNFWYFDREYFPPAMFRNYATPNRMHRNMHRLWFIPGLHTIAGSRRSGKTAYEKKGLIWQLLTGKKLFAGVLCETLLKSSLFVQNIAELIIDNPRLLHDYRPEFTRNNTDLISFNVFATAEHSRHQRIVSAFSEERSVRGHTDKFRRPDYLIIEDMETRNSPMGREQTKSRIRIISEAYQSLDSGAVAMNYCNLFDERCAMNQLFIEHELGILPPTYTVHKYPAYDRIKQRPLWESAWGDVNESQLRDILSPLDDSEWESEFMQNPRPPDGDIFKREYYKQWTELPDDARGVMYCDPNLSEKSKGDSTAMGGLLYSPSTQKYYIVRPRCRSYSSSIQLLDDYFSIRSSSDAIRRCGFDGNFKEQSTWKDNVRNYASIRGLPTPPIVFCRYRVDEFSKNTQIIYERGELMFPPDGEWVSDNERTDALKQFFGFAGKKANKRDDFPDFLICSMELLWNEKFIRKPNPTVMLPPVSITDSYSF